MFIKNGVFISQLWNIISGTPYVSLNRFLSKLQSDCFRLLVEQNGILLRF